MARQVVWSPEAVEDADNIAEYIARDSAFYASAVVEKFLLTARLLVEHPETGRIVPELDDSAIRERFVYSYRMIYQLRANDILIVAIIHGRRLLEQAAIESRLAGS